MEAVRAEDTELPFILYTAEGNEDIASEAISAGVTEYIQKGDGTEQYEQLANRIHDTVRARRETLRAQRLQQLRGSSEFAGNTGGIEMNTETDEIRLTDGANRILDLPEDPDHTVEDWLELFHPDDRTEIRQAIHRATETGEQTDGTWQYQPSDGEQRFLDISLKPVVTDEDGRWLQGAIHDITDRKERRRGVERHETLDRTDKGAETSITPLEEDSEQYLDTADQDVILSVGVFHNRCVPSMALLPVIVPIYRENYQDFRRTVYCTGRTGSGTRTGRNRGHSLDSPPPNHPLEYPGNGPCHRR